MGKREDEYISQLQALGTYEDAFYPVVHELCILERELSRARKEWKDSKTPGEKHASLASPLYDRIRQLRTDILTHQDALGLTPKGLRKLKGPAQKTGPNAQDTLTQLLDAFKEAANGSS